MKRRISNLIVIKSKERLALASLIVVIILFGGCFNKNQSKLQNEKSKNNRLVKKCYKEKSVFRSEISLFQIKNNNPDSILKTLNKDYPYFFQDTLFDFFKDIMKDPNYNIIFDSVYTHFNDKLSFAPIINNGFCVLSNYFGTSQPNIITMIDDDIIDTFSPPFNPIAYNKKENIVLIQLQWFLGQDHVFYTHRRQPIPDYLTERYESKYIPSMVFHSMSQSYIINNNKDAQLLTAMINEAKPYFFIEMILPNLEDHLIFGSSQVDIDFFNSNVGSMWKYILQNQFLFSSQSILKQHFILPAKTTQLGTPGRFGIWIGWQILRSYFNNNDVTIKEILESKDYLEILNNSNYKP